MSKLAQTYPIANDQVAFTHFWLHNRRRGGASDGGASGSDDGSAVASGRPRVVLDYEARLFLNLFRMRRGALTAVQDGGRLLFRPVWEAQNQSACFVHDNGHNLKGFGYDVGNSLHWARPFNMTWYRHRYRDLLVEFPDRWPWSSPLTLES